MSRRSSNIIEDELHDSPSPSLSVRPLTFLSPDQVSMNDSFETVVHLNKPLE
jgi:hypothetical protein